MIFKNPFDSCSRIRSIYCTRLHTLGEVGGRKLSNYRTTTNLLVILFELDGRNFLALTFLQAARSRLCSVPQRSLSTTPRPSMCSCLYASRNLCVNHRGTIQNAGTIMCDSVASISWSVQHIFLIILCVSWNVHKSVIDKIWSALQKEIVQRLSWRLCQFVKTFRRRNEANTQLIMHHFVSGKIQKLQKSFFLLLLEAIGNTEQTLNISFEPIT